MPQKIPIRQPFKRALQSLPTYAGGKRRLLKWIFQKLASAVPPEQWSRLTFADGFAGGGSVSLFAKAHGFAELHLNDWGEVSQAVLQGLVANNDIRLSREDLLCLAQPLPEEGQGFIEREFGGSVFARRHARYLDQITTNLSKWENPTKRALAQLLLCHLVPEFCAFATSIGSSNRPFAEVLDGKREWQLLNPKRLSDGSFASMLEPCWKKAEAKRQLINRGVFGAAGPVKCYRLDVFEFIRKVQGDVLYLDGPYAKTLSYSSQNHVLDAVLAGKMPEKLTSPFTQGTEALSELLAASRHFPVILVSYGNQVLDLEELKALVCRSLSNHQVSGWSKLYRHFAHVSKNVGNQELLVLAVNNNVTIGGKR